MIAGQEFPKTSVVMSGLVLDLELQPIKDPGPWLDYKRGDQRLASVPDDHLLTLVTAAAGSPRVIGNLLANLRRAANPA